MSGELFWNIKIADAATKADKDENEELCRKFSLKDAVVRIKRLTVNDLSQLRQPCVKLCRLESEKVIPLKRSLRKVEHKCMTKIHSHRINWLINFFIYSLYWT